MTEAETKDAYICARALARSVLSELHHRRIPKQLDDGQSAAIRLACQKMESAVVYVATLRVEKVKARKKT